MRPEDGQLLEPAAPHRQPQRGNIGIQRAYRGLDRDFPP